MLTLYLDEDSMDQELARALRARGVDVVTASEADMVERSDVDQLRWATSQGRAIVSFNVGDFQRLHTRMLADGESHAGIILMQQQRYSIGERMRRLLRLAASRSSEDMRSRVEFLSNWG